MFMGISMWIAVMFLASWLSPATKRKLVGLGLLTDIAVHALLQSLFAGTGEERVGMLLAGILINLTMHTYKKLYGWETLSGKRYAGRLT